MKKSEENLNKEAVSAEARRSAKADRLFVESLARGFRVIEAFANAPRPMSHAELAEIAGFDKSAVQRLTHTLVKLGYLARTQAGVVPGHRILERSFDYLRASPLVNRAVPVLADLRRSLNERVDLSLFDDTTMLYVLRMQSKRDTLSTHLIGARVPTFCTSGGRAVLSRLPQDRVLDILARSDRTKLTPKTTTEIPEILKRIAQVRETGYSLALEEVLIGEVAVGAAILDNSGSPIAALHIVGSLSEWTPQEFVRRVGPLAAAAANGLKG